MHGFSLQQHGFRSGEIHGDIDQSTRQKQLEASIESTKERLYLALESARIGTWDLSFVHGNCAIDAVNDDFSGTPVPLTGGNTASVLGNEASIRFGRRRLVATAMILSILFAATVGFLGSLSYWLAVVLLVVYGMVVWLDSSSVTAGAAGNAEPGRRGATLAVHSTLGYAGGFVGPLIVGWTLDLAGGMSAMAWGLAFAVVAAFMLAALAIFLAIRPRELEGDRARRRRWRLPGRPDRHRPRRSSSPRRWGCS